MSLIKSSQDIVLLRKAGQKLANVLSKAAVYAQPGVSLIELDRFIAKEIAKEGAKPAFLGFEGFPNVSTLSLNSEVVHGIPDERTLSEGDIIGIDSGLWLGHVCVDAALTVPIGKIPEKTVKLLDTTLAALKAGVKAAKAFRRVGNISYTVQQFAENEHLGIVRALTGHGVGHHLHESPAIPNYGRADDGILLRPGMVLAIEPMFTLGSGDVYTSVDGWTVLTADHSLAAQYEYTVVITERGAEILTPWSLPTVS